MVKFVFSGFGTRARPCQGAALARDCVRYGTLGKLGGGRRCGTRVDERERVCFFGFGGAIERVKGCDDGRDVGNADCRFMDVRVHG